MPEKVIKILVDAHVFDNYYQGTSTYIIGLYTSLVNYSDIEITLCAGNISSLKSIFTNPSFKFLKLKSVSTFTRLFIEFPRIIKDGKFDFCHFQYIVPFFVGKCHVINTMHDILFLDYPQYFSFSYRQSRRLIFRASAKKSHLLLTVSDYSKRALIQHFNIEPEKIFVTPNAVAHSKVSYVEREFSLKYPLGKYILYVSRFEPRKNHEILLKSYLNLKLYELGISLVFVGSKKDSIEKSAYDLLIQSIPPSLKSFILFFENIDQNDLTGLYINCSCFVYPSLAEGFGIPPIEAGALRAKVVCSNSTAMADFKFFKYRFDPENCTQLMQKILEALNDLDYPFDEIQEAILQQYNWAHIAGALHMRLQPTTVS